MELPFLWQGLVSCVILRGNEGSGRCCSTPLSSRRDREAGPSFEHKLRWWSRRDDRAWWEWRREWGAGGPHCWFIAARYWPGRNQQQEEAYSVHLLSFCITRWYSTWIVMCRAESGTRVDGSILLHAGLRESSFPFPSWLHVPLQLQGSHSWGINSSECSYPLPLLQLNGYSPYKVTKWQIGETDYSRQQSVTPCF